MKQHIFIVDYIGKHSGMHYYNESFEKILNEAGFKTYLLSNYSVSSNSSPFFYNIYKKNKLFSILLLKINFCKLFLKLLFTKNSTFIIYHYGGWLDVILFSQLLLFKNKIIVDVHEIYSLDNVKGIILKKIININFKYLIKNVISHSVRTDLLLNKIGYTKVKLEVPHFKYCFDLNIDEKKINDEIKNSISKKNVNLLFFGHIRESKGIEYLINEFNSLSSLEVINFNLIIAGRDSDSLLKKYSIKYLDQAQLILRHIKDDEMKFLFKNSDYIILPYKEISQSGVVEMAIYNKTPMILSNIENFSSILEHYPSFGRKFDLKESSLRKTIIELVTKEEKSFYLDFDIEKYNDKKSILEFVHKFKNNLN